MLLAASIEQTLIRSYFIGCYRIWYWYYHTIIPEVVVISIEIQWYLTKSEAGCMTFWSFRLFHGSWSIQRPMLLQLPSERCLERAGARQKSTQRQNGRCPGPNSPTALVEGFRTSIRWMHYRLVWWYMISMSWEIWKCIIVNHSTS
jgi:hypothetical protein